MISSSLGGDLLLSGTPLVDSWKMVTIWYFSSSSSLLDSIGLPHSLLSQQFPLALILLEVVFRIMVWAIHGVGPMSGPVSLHIFALVLKCTKCQKIGHIAQVCRGPNGQGRSDGNKKTRGTRGRKDKQGSKPQFTKQATEEVREAKQDNNNQGNRGEPEIVQCNAARARSGCATPTLLL